MKKFLIKITSAILMLALCVGLSGCFLFNIDRGDIANLPDSAAKSQNVVTDTKPEGRPVLEKTALVEDVRRSVVAIMMKNSSGTSYGSGVIVGMNKTDDQGVVSDSGSTFYVLTCHHVIDGGGEITLFVPDLENDNPNESDYDYDFAFTGHIGTKVAGDQVTLVGGDQKSDVAVLKLSIAGSNVSPSQIKKAYFPIDSYSPKVAEDVIAIGNPTGGLPGTVSVGTISYLNRETSITGVGDMTLMQINVDIYHGSSGGALFNMYGELIGITNGGSDEYSGLNYAIPFVVDESQGVKDNGFINVAKQLLATATANNYGYLSHRICQFGFTVVTDPEKKTVTVTAVTEGSIANQVGILAGDVVKRISTTIEGLDTSADVTENSALSTIIGSLRGGDKFYLRVERTVGEQTSVIDLEFEAVQYIFADTGYYPTSLYNSVQSGFEHLC
ncbi:MAG: trypsin-like peptidase domain-containing protein [Clostridia bacterium]|nr:trypsin-like peptidase domain-containing protein [Clostridia bacterium]